MGRNIIMPYYLQIIIGTQINPCPRLASLVFGTGYICGDLITSIVTYNSFVVLEISLIIILNDKFRGRRILNN